SRALSFFGPQLGCSLRSSTSAAITFSAVLCGHVNAIGARSTNPAGPSSSYRSRHLYPVFRLIPNLRHSPSNDSWLLLISVMNSTPWSTQQPSFQGNGSPPPPLSHPRVLCHPGSRSDLSPGRPVCTITSGSRGITLDSHGITSDSHVITSGADVI